MTPGVPTRVIAAVGGLAAFAVALIAGLTADNPAGVVLVRGLVALGAGHVVGWIIGAVGERTILEAVEQHKGSSPIPSEAEAEHAAGAKAGSIPEV